MTRTNLSSVLLALTTLLLQPAYEASAQNTSPSRRPEKRPGRIKRDANPARGGKQKAAKAVREVRVYKLQNIDSKVFVTTVKALHKDVRLAVNEQASNAVIVYGSKADHDSIANLLEKLDRKPDVRKRLQIYNLRHIKPSKQLIDILQISLGENPDVRVAIDASTNRIIARGKEQDLRVVEAVLQQLDQPVETPTLAAQHMTFQIRVLWLTTHKSVKSSGPGFTMELVPIMNELQKVGIKLPRVVNQLIVSTSAGEGFTVSGKVRRGNKLWSISVDGELTFESKEGTKVKSFRVPRLQISVKTHPLNSQEKTQVDLKTTIPAPLGSYSVLGVSPNEDGTNLFVIRVDQKLSKPARRRR